MWRIAQFLGKFSNVILFLVLELVALLIVFTLNKSHREASQGIMLNLTGSVSEVQSSIGGYFNLGTENEKILDQNAALLQEIQLLRDSLKVYKFRQPVLFDYRYLPDSLKQDSLYMDSLRIPMDLPDSIFPAGTYVFLPCQAVNNSVSKNYNYITIDKGSRNGLREGMGLISPEGVVGQLIAVSQNYALAQSLLNKKFNLSARILGNKNIGTISWNGADPNFANLNFIPQTSSIKVGDPVVTSGYSTIFPKDYQVGRVSDFNAKNQDGFFQIEVELATNFRGLDNMFVVTHERRIEIDTLDTKKLDQ